MNNLIFGSDSDDENWVFLDPANDDPFIFIGQDMQNKRLLGSVRTTDDLGVIRALEAGADIEARTFRGNDDTALTLAANQNNMALVQILLDRGARVQAVNNSGRSALSYAAMHGNTYMVKELIRRGAPLDHRDILLEYTPLAFAALCNRVEVARILLDCGANIESRDMFGLTPFLIAANNRKIEMVDFLVKRGANIQAREKEGCNALALTAPYQPIYMVHHLIQLGVNVNAQDISGNSCAWKLVTIDFRDQESVKDHIKVLLDNGLDKDIRNNAGYTLLDMARQHNRDSIVEFLETYQTDVQ